MGLDGSPEPSSEALRAIGMKGYDKPQGMYNWELVQSGMLGFEPVDTLSCDTQI